MILVGYQGIGKSTLAKHNLKYIDLESSSFWIKDGESVKRYDDWYKIYVQQAYHLSEQGYNVFISSHKVICEYLNELNINYVTISPDINLYHDWVNKLKDRYYQEPCDKNHKTLMDCIQRYNKCIEYLQSQNFSIILKDKDYDLEKEIEHFTNIYSI